MAWPLPVPIRPARRTAFAAAQPTRPRNDPIVASGFVESLIAHCGRLTATPFMGPLRSDLGPEIRALFVRRHYAVLYRVEPNGDVQVIRVIHAARDIRRVLKVDE